MELAGRKSIWWGLSGALLLMSFYWLVLILVNSLAHAVEQWRLWWYWIVLLTVGFGSQVGLYSSIRYTIRDRKMKGRGFDMAATGSVSAGSMVTCCAHHVVDILPIISVSDEAVRFEVGLNTHQGDLNFKLTEQSLLTDDRGREYKPVEWKGESGGHHLTGELVFSSLDKGVKKVKLVISDVYGVKERLFKWNLELL